VTRACLGLWRRPKLFSVQAEFGPNYRGDFRRIQLNHAIRRLKSKPRLARRGHSAHELPKACRIARQTESHMNHSQKRPFTKNGGARTVSKVRLGVPAFAVDEQCLKETARAPRRFNETAVDEFDSRSTRRPTGAITQVLEEVTTQRRRTLDEALDALQLLTVTDVCKLLRISKPTLWRLRRSGNFPDPTTVTERIFGWRRSEIDAWLASRPNSRRY
jgi:predicted DNA-binding transcriptional regulator AlpA